MDNPNTIPPDHMADTDRIADPIARLLALTNLTTAYSTAVYGDQRRTVGAGLFLDRRRLLLRLAEAARAVTIEYGPAAGLDAAERRAGLVRELAAVLLNWAIRHRGRQPPPWPTEEEPSKEKPTLRKMMQEAATLPPWAGDEKVCRAEAEWAALWKELRAAREQLELLWQVREAKDKAGRAAPARHSCDFASVHWFGADYSFTAAQAAIVRILWQAWANGTPDVRHDTLLEDSGAISKRLHDIFRSNRAWGTLIVPGVAKGTARLNEPQKKS